MSFTFNEEKIEPSKSAKYPGVLIDNTLKFNEHITYLESKISRSVGIIARLSRYLLTKTLTILYHSLVSTHLLYALSAWASTCASYIHTVKMLQNKVTRIVTKTSKFEPISPQYYDLKILKLDDLYHYETAQLMYQNVHKMLPTHLVITLLMCLTFILTPPVIIRQRQFLYLDIPPREHKNLLNILELKYGTKYPNLLSNYLLINLRQNIKSFF